MSSEAPTTAIARGSKSLVSIACPGLSRSSTVVRQVRVDYTDATLSVTFQTVSAGVEAGTFRPSPLSENDTFVFRAAVGYADESRPGEENYRHCYRPLRRCVPRASDRR